ncbi:MAG: hypothetical protein WBJ62_07480 [Coriobacteriia bacterium]
MIEARRVWRWSFGTGMLLPLVFLPTYAAEYALVRREYGSAQVVSLLIEFTVFLVLGGAVTSCVFAWLEMRWRRSGRGDSSAPPPRE